MNRENRIKVSVIVYVKNTVNYIEQCIRSVMEQTLREIEILVVDGGSTDGTQEVIDRLKNVDDRIRVFYGPASVGAQFNLGLCQARGEYIGICEADDYILPDMYERQYQIANEHCLDVIRAGYYQIFSVNDREYRFERDACNNNDLTQKVITSCSGNDFLSQGINGFWSGLYRKQFLLDNGISMNETKGAAYQDITFSFLTQMYAKRFWFMREAFYCYRMDNPDASVNSRYGTQLHMREYEKLAQRLTAARQWERYKNFFFSWELLSYQWLLKELPKDLRESHVQTLYDCLNEQVKKDHYDMEQLMESGREAAAALFSDKISFMRHMLLETEQGEWLRTYVETTFKKDKKVVLFGIGKLGNMVRAFLELEGKEIMLTDNSIGLQQSGFSGRTVYKPEWLASQFPYETYIIASAVHAKDMREQLLLLGVSEENIFICDDEEFFLRRIFVNRKSGWENLYVERR